jgi:hypothetical protein
LGITAGERPHPQVHQVQRHVVGVPLDQQPDLVDVARRAGAGVDVHHEPVRAGGREDRVELRAAGLVAGPAAEQERQLRGRHAALTCEGERLLGGGRVLGAR